MTPAFAGLACLCSHFKLGPALAKRARRECTPETVDESTKPRGASHGEHLAREQRREKMCKKTPRDSLQKQFRSLHLLWLHAPLGVQPRASNSPQGALARGRTQSARRATSTQRTFLFLTTHNTFCTTQKYHCFTNARDQLFPSALATSTPREMRHVRRTRRRASCLGCARPQGGSADPARRFVFACAGVSTKRRRLLRTCHVRMLLLSRPLERLVILFGHRRA